MRALSGRLVVASGNEHKVGELRAMLTAAAPDLEVVGLDAYPESPDVAETEDTFEGNAALKARGVADWLRAQGETGAATVLADDSGICVDALDGGPGVGSARFAGSDADDEANNAKLVREFQRMGIDASPGHYRCVLALTRVDRQPLCERPGDPVVLPGDLGRAMTFFKARWDVVVRVDRRGDGGFGYDPHAWLPDDHRTVAELSQDEKARMSHRGKALRRLLAWVTAAPP